MERYTHDYLFALALLSAFIGLLMCDGARDGASPLRRSADTLFVALCALSVGLCLLLGFVNERSMIRQASPDFYYSLVRMFYPY